MATAVKSKPQRNIPAVKLFNMAREADIVKIISQTVHLQQSGQHYLGLCPFHQDGKVGSFKVTPARGNQKGIFTCFSCGAQGDVIDFVAHTKKVSPFEAAIQVCEASGFISRAEAKSLRDNKGLEPLQNQKAPDLKIVQVPPQPQKPPVQQELLAEKRDAEHLNMVYLAFIRSAARPSRLYKNRMREERKLSDEELNEYFIYPNPHDQAFLARFFRNLAELFGTTDIEELKQILLGVPGFFLTPDDKISFMVSRKTGIGIAVRNRQGLLVGIQIRIIEPLPEGASRYLFMSSGFANGVEGSCGRYGCRCGHVEDVLYPEKKWCKAIAITEGRFKAVTLSKMGFLTVNMHGITNWQFAAEVASELCDEYNAKMFVLVYDQEEKEGTEQNVKKSARQLTDYIQDRAPVQFAVWDHKYGKGIDDVVNAGYQSKIKRVTPEKFF